MQEHLFRHFCSKRHEGFLKDASVALIEKTNSSDPKKRKNSWMRALRTLTPDGINVENTV